MKQHYQIAIVGAGLVGTTLAAMLAKLSYQIALIDQKPQTIISASTTTQDIRTIALSHQSQSIFMRLGLWEKLAEFAYPIKQIHISDKNHFGVSRILASEMDVSALGYVISLACLLNHIDEMCAQFSNIDFIQPARLTNLTIENQQALLSLLHDQQAITITADLIIAVDGSYSSVRQLAGIKNQEIDYHQSAIVCNVGVTEKSFIAYERFTEHGPLACLPVSDHTYAIVWSMTPTLANARMRLSEQEFLHELQQAFGYRLGKWQWLGARQVFPLKQIIAKQMIQPNLVLIGNAMHTLHPIAGQGFNLGLRDAAVLAKLLSQQQYCLNDFDLLKQYEKARKLDQKSMLHLTDKLVKLFSNKNNLLTVSRNLGLLGLDYLPIIKETLASKMMGYISIDG